MPPEWLKIISNHIKTLRRVRKPVKFLWLYRSKSNYSEHLAAQTVSLVMSGGKCTEVLSLMITGLEKHAAVA